MGNQSGSLGRHNFGDEAGNRQPITSQAQKYCDLVVKATSLHTITSVCLLECAEVENNTVSRPPLSLAMRLTAELSHNSLSYLNPLKERELDLRGMSEKSRCYTLIQGHS
jgi:hypothetical protein